MTALRIPPYTGWAEQQAPTVMTHRAKAAADAHTGLALLQVVAAQWEQLRSGVRHLLTHNPN